MWVFLSDAFLSIVQDRLNHRKLWVRARIKGDIERVFPRAIVIEGAGSDYQFRALISRTEVSRAMREAVARIDYPNFKDSVREPERHEVYLGIWSSLGVWQDANVLRGRPGYLSEPPPDEPGDDHIYDGKPETWWKS